MPSYQTVLKFLLQAETGQMQSQMAQAGSALQNLDRRKLAMVSTAGRLSSSVASLGHSLGGLNSPIGSIVGGLARVTGGFVGMGAAAGVAGAAIGAAFAGVPLIIATVTKMLQENENILERRRKFIEEMEKRPTPTEAAEGAERLAREPEDVRRELRIQKETMEAFAWIQKQRKEVSHSRFWEFLYTSETLDALAKSNAELDEYRDRLDKEVADSRVRVNEARERRETEEALAANAHARLAAETPRILEEEAKRSISEAREAYAAWFAEYEEGVRGAIKAADEFDAAQKRIVDYAESIREAMDPTIKGMKEFWKAIEAKAAGEITEEELAWKLNEIRRRYGEGAGRAGTPWLETARMAPAFAGTDPISSRLDKQLQAILKGNECLERIARTVGLAS